MTIYQIALPIPKRQLFDYLCEDSTLQVGIRVSVPFGPRSLVGIVMAKVDESEHQSKLKTIKGALDTTPVLDETLLYLCQWLSQYYHHPIGEVVHAALPVALRKGVSSLPKPTEYLLLSENIPADAHESMQRAKKQLMLFDTLQIAAQPISKLKQHFSTAVINALIEKTVAVKRQITEVPETDWLQTLTLAERPIPNIQQSLAITTISNKIGSYAAFLIEGVTGSGKTEVYLQAIEEVLKKQQQVLILVPEIGLTPQTVSRFENRFGLPVGVLHSNLTDNERLLVWQKSKSAALPMLIGTRSAIFTPMPNLGMIIVDEEHDVSYKQQDGLRYNARDLAVIRARRQQVPLVLGSATPCLETLNNALHGKYQHLELTERAGNAVHARQNLLDITNQPLQSGIAQGMLDRMETHLKAGSQVMIFINRRGYAPALLCHQCGFVEECKRCNKPYTVHKSLNKIQCHYCGGAKPIPSCCSYCNSQDISAQGVGTEQLEISLTNYFPQYSSVRIDSDSARGKAKLNRLLDDINKGKHAILIGTQILSKGHHFPNVTLVVILDADGALFSADYRAAEHLAQLITQLSGRAGRADKPGEMWLQTHQPGHPLLQDLVHNGYAHFARYALLERKEANLPPYSFQGLFRAEATQANLAFEFLSEVAMLIRDNNIRILGPVPALMEKRQGRYRMQLLLQATDRRTINQSIARQINTIENHPLARKVRWSIDIDPQDFI